MEFDKNFLKINLLIISDVDNEYTPAEKAKEEMYLRTLFEQIESYGVHVVYEEVLNARELKDVLKKYDKDSFVVFNWCERFNMTDGNETEVTKVLDELGFVYTGCQTKNLALLTNKYKWIQMLNKKDIKVPESYLVNKENYQHLDIDFSKKYFVKTNNLHASSGVSFKNIVTDKDAYLIIAKKLLDNVSEEVLVQKFIEGEEFTDVVWGNMAPQALPILKINFGEKMEHNVYTYNAKFETDSYEYGNSKYTIFDKNSNPDLYQKIEEVAIRAQTILKLEDYARFDVRYDGKNVYLIDINANPYLNGILYSEVYISTAALGYNWGETILKICEYAYKRSLN